MKNNKIISLIVLVFLLACSMAGAIEKTKVAIVLAPSGKFANVRGPIINGIRLFFKDKKDIELEFFEHGDELSEQSNAAKEIEKKNIHLVIGHNSSGVAKLFLKSFSSGYKISYVTPLATSLELKALNEGVFVNWPNNELQIDAIVRFLKSKLIKSPKIAMIVNESESYSTEMAKLFEEKVKAMSAKEISKISYLGDKFEPDQITDQLTGLKPDVVFAPIYSYDLMTLYNSFLSKSASRHIIFVSGDTMGSEELVFKKLAENKRKLSKTQIYFTSGWAPEMKTPRSFDFITQYKKNYGTDPLATAIAGYDSAEILYASLIKAKSQDPTAVNAALRSFRGEILAGKVEMSENQTLVRKVPILSLTPNGYKFYGQY